MNLIDKILVGTIQEIVGFNWKIEENLADEYRTGDLTSWNVVGQGSLDLCREKT